MVSNQYIRRLSKDTQALCRQHLLDLISTDEDTGDSHREKIILEIPQRESQQNADVVSITQHYHPEVATHWQIKVQALCRHHGPRQGSFPIWQCNGSPLNLLQIFILASDWHLPLWQDTLSIGHLGRNLRFPTNTDKWTIKILQEAHFTDVKGTSIPPYPSKILRDAGNRSYNGQPHPVEEETIKMNQLRVPHSSSPARVMCDTPTPFILVDNITRWWNYSPVLGYCWS